MIRHLDKFETIVPNVLTICTYTEFAPFSYEEEGRIIGSDILFLRKFAHEMGLGVSIIKKGFDGLWATPGNNECDVSAAGMMDRKERNLGENGAWSQPYMIVKRSLLIRRTDEDVFKAPSDFNGKKIVVTPASSADIDARERYEPLGAKIIPLVPSQDQVVRQLLNYEIDAFGEGTVSNEYLQRKYVDHDGSLLLALTDIHTMDLPEHLRFAVRAADKKLLRYLNRFIDTTI